MNDDLGQVLHVVLCTMAGAVGGGLAGLLMCSSAAWWAAVAGLYAAVAVGCTTAAVPHLIASVLWVRGERRRYRLLQEQKVDP